MTTHFVLQTALSIRSQWMYSVRQFIKVLWSSLHQSTTACHMYSTHTVYTRTHALTHTHTTLLFLSRVVFMQQEICLSMKCSLDYLITCFLEWGRPLYLLYVKIISKYVHYISPWFVSCEECERIESGEIKDGLREQTEEEAAPLKHNNQSWEECDALIGFHSRKHSSS